MIPPPSSPSHSLSPCCYFPPSPSPSSSLPSPNRFLSLCPPLLPSFSLPSASSAVSASPCPSSPLISPIFTSALSRCLSTPSSGCSLPLSPPPPHSPYILYSAHAIPSDESPLVKFFISGTVALTFELIVGHYLEFLKISKQTSTLSYAQLTRQMIQHKGIIGVLDGFFPWGAIQCFVKGASFGFGQSLGLNMLKGRCNDFTAEVLSGGIGGGVQGLVMSPLLLLKTRVMTMPEMRTSGGALATVIASSKMGVRVVREEGPFALMKGSATFSSKRVADWTTRYFFAEVCADALRRYRVKERGVAEKQVKLTFIEHSAANVAGGALSATATLPIDVIVATMQSAGKAGQKTSIIGLFKEQMDKGGIRSLIEYSTRGYVARVAHVAATTLLMKSVSTAVYGLYAKVKE